MFQIISFLSKRIVSSVVLFLTLLLPLSISSMDSAKSDPIAADFMDYVKHSKLPPKELLHHMKSQDFEGKHYKFSSATKDSYLHSIKDPHFPQYTPEGLPENVHTSSHAGGHLLTIHWVMLDNPTPGMKTKEEMTFNVTELKN